MKVSTQSRYLRPALAIVDPEFSLTCPRKVTADSGIDALTHAIEGYIPTREPRILRSGSTSRSPTRGRTRLATSSPSGPSASFIAH